MPTIPLALRPALLAATLAFAPAAVAQTDTLAARWNAGDVAGVAALLAENASVVRPRDEWRGREVIVGVWLAQAVPATPVVQFEPETKRDTSGLTTETGRYALATLPPADGEAGAAADAALPVEEGAYTAVWEEGGGGAVRLLLLRFDPDAPASGGAR